MILNKKACLAEEHSSSCTPTTDQDSGTPSKALERDVPAAETRSVQPADRLQRCSSILKDLLSERHYDYAWPFYKPVDTVALGLYDYHLVIQEPMDLGTIKVTRPISWTDNTLVSHCRPRGIIVTLCRLSQEKMEQKKYADAKEFAADVRLMFSNCCRYNSPTHEIIPMARKLQVGLSQSLLCSRRETPLISLFQALLNLQTRKQK